MKTYTGACHCGKVKFEAQTDLDMIIEGNCSHCGIKSLLLAFIPASQFKLLSGEDNLTEYRFNKHVIEHLFCKTCGVQPFGRGTDPKGVTTVALNVRTLKDVDLKALTITPFDCKSM